MRTEVRGRIGRTRMAELHWLSRGLGYISKLHLRLREAESPNHDVEVVEIALDPNVVVWSLSRDPHLWHDGLRCVVRSADRERDQECERGSHGARVAVMGRASTLGSFTVQPDFCTDESAPSSVCAIATALGRIGL